MKQLIDTEYPLNWAPGTERRGKEVDQGSGGQEFILSSGRTSGSGLETGDAACFRSRHTYTTCLSPLEFSLGIGDTQTVVEEEEVDNRLVNGQDNDMENDVHQPTCLDSAVGASREIWISVRSTVEEQEF